MFSFDKLGAHNWEGKQIPVARLGILFQLQEQQPVQHDNCNDRTSFEHRSLSCNLLNEPSILMVLFVSCLVSKSTSLFPIASAIAEGNSSGLFSLVLLLVGQNSN